jgi:hypothetical protein
LAHEPFAFPSIFAGDLDCGGARTVRRARIRQRSFGARPDRGRDRSAFAGRIALATKSLEQVLTHADAPTRAVLAKYPDLLVVRPPRVNPCVAPDLYRGFREQHAANVAIAKRGGIDLLLMGDSITDFWREPGPTGAVNPPQAGKAVFDEYFGKLRTANFGIAGDSTQGVLYRLRAHDGARRESHHRALHDGKHVFYLDIGAKFLASDGTIPPDVMADELHPTEKGYRIWAEAVKAPLAKLMK